MCLSWPYNAVPVRIVGPNRVHWRCRRTDAREGPAVDPGTRRGSEVPRYTSSPPRARHGQSSTLATCDAPGGWHGSCSRVRSGARRKNRLPSRPKSTFADTTRPESVEYQVVMAVTTHRNGQKAEDLRRFTAKHSCQLDIMALIRSWRPSGGLPGRRPDSL